MIFTHSDVTPDRVNHCTPLHCMLPHRLPATCVTSRMAGGCIFYKRIRSRGFPQWSEHGTIPEAAEQGSALRKDPTMATTVSREIHLKNRPIGLPSESDFELVTVPVPAPGAGAVLVRNLYMSVD